MSNGIEITAAPTLLRITGEETAESIITLRNRGQTVDQFTINVEGLNPEWYTLPVSSVALFPNDQDNAKVIINIPDARGLGGTSYSFRVKVTSQENPTNSAVVELTLEIGAALKVDMNLSPAHLSGTKGEYLVNVNNPDTKDCVVQLKTSSAQGRMLFSNFRLPIPGLILKLPKEPLTIPARKSVDVNLATRLNWLALIIWEKTYDFKVVAVKPEDITTEEASQSGQLTSVPWYRIFSRLRLPWLAKPPVIKSFTAATDDKREFQLKWTVRKATSVKVDDSDVESEGESLIRPEETKQYVLAATNRYGTSTKTVELTPLPKPQARTSDKIKVSLSGLKLQTQAGLVPAQATVQVQNLSDIVDKFTIEVNGLDDSWYSRSAASIALMPQAIDQVQISFLPPKKKGVKSGTFTFGVTVRSQSVTEEYACVLGQLEIMPSVEYKLSIRPFRVTGMRKGTLVLNLANVGVSPTEISVEAHDSEDKCKFMLEQQKVALNAWNTKEIPVIVKPKRNSILNQEKRFDLTFTSNTDGGTPQITNGEFNHKPFMKSWKPIWRIIKAAIALAVIIVAIYYILKIGGGWSALRESPQTWVSNFTTTISGWFNR